MPVHRGLVTDANVLIDYSSTDESVLALTSRHLGPVIVPSPVLDEVELLDVPACERLGIRVVEPTLDQLLEAASQRGRLSFEDRLCLILARDGGWLCVTNDRRLRAACEAAGVPVVWSLELLIELVGAGELPPQVAISIAADLHLISPRHITAAILAEFDRQIEARLRRPR
jgi:predicted nucleic acid-binding protein